MSSDTGRADPIGAVLNRLPGRPLRATTTLLWDTLRSYNEHRGGDAAAAMAYYTLFSLFPLILFLLSAAGFVLGQADLNEQIMAIVSSYLPGSDQLIGDVIHQVIAARGTMSLIAIVGLLWSASGMFSSLAVAVERAWSPSGDQPPWRYPLIGVTITLSVGILIILSLATSAAMQIVTYYRDALLPSPIAAILPPASSLSVVASVFTNVAFFFVLYKWVPRVRVPWRAALLAAGIVGLTWEVAKYIFTWYLANVAVGGLNRTYGSVGAVIALLLWIYLSALLILLGAELSAAYARRHC
jgi:membrane protein